MTLSRRLRLITVGVVGRRLAERTDERDAIIIIHPNCQNFE
jgi:hypothetical protein